MGWVYGIGSFAILSLRFCLISATGADFLVEKRDEGGRTSVLVDGFLRWSKSTGS